MAYASGYITVETEIDVNDYDGQFEIEFDGLSDVIDTAIAEGHTPEEIIDYCFVSISNFFRFFYFHFNELYQLFIINTL